MLALFIFLILADLLRFTVGKKIRVCLASFPFTHLEFHISSNLSLTMVDITLLLEPTVMGGPFPRPSAPSLASSSASSLPSYPMCALIQFILVFRSALCVLRVNRRLFMHLLFVSWLFSALTRAWLSDRISKSARSSFRPSTSERPITFY